MLFTLTLQIPSNEKLELQSFLCHERERTPPSPTCCYARYCFKFECALSHIGGGRGLDQLLVVGNGDALV